MVIIKIQVALLRPQNNKSLLYWIP